ncbi:hypothetical protein PHYBLDRAFT_167201 [Phycomyces blakesleeanus NRRL 1555(-)]|uniref:Uncharacterized protein n=1 Tax=Phycomyces blakesleeanus (strain ATCC 8743b / DSM 1359 / FGSC 10004 / NBRC 33097 / NRRL 1555) TaxID=763407 RepID=A0A162PPU2_PHYB8|nr:hypothetical protein PHYBLDRAFT_167201 [Phycomyces blakesleeanus NRRL 1555(-)]OAD74857.1 hypothetical protein PHYBLDRAFT_167201 [Phycomyces blakesleeanus NRRL 1555(-)]|eukprot:XP_018292897.1 hypothetical protein PHYBLDRAFT_167201 [Phycomyces blakesleeanus NRRL 1555(-)]
MSSTIKQNFEECYCTECIKNYNGYTLVSKRTAQRHGKKAALKDAIRTFILNTGAQRHVMNFDAESIVVQESGSIEVLAHQSDLPVLDISPMSVDYEIDVDFNDMDFEYESNENVKDTVDIDVEEVDTEYLYENMFSNSNMSENPVHRFIATFIVLFASRYVVNKGTVVLIEFINKLLKIYEQDFQLPTNLPGLQHMMRFCELSKGIRRFVACEDCHAIYKENQSVPSCCVFVKTGACAACNCELTKKSSSGVLIPKRIFYYQSIKNTFKILFNHPGFEEKILRGTIIDPMHNLFLGTAKRMMDQQIERGVLGDRDFTAMQKIADKMILPRAYTALKSKIDKKFAFMKADDYWLIAFERYNSLLKNISTNGRDGFEATFMRCFVEDIYKSDFVNSALTCPTQAPFLSALFKLVCSSIPVLTLTSASSTIVQPPFILQAFVNSSETARITTGFIHSIGAHFHLISIRFHLIRTH